MSHATGAGPRVRPLASPSSPDDSEGSPHLASSPASASPRGSAAPALPPHYGGPPTEEDQEAAPTSREDQKTGQEQTEQDPSALWRPQNPSPPPNASHFGGSGSLASSVSPSRPASPVPLGSPSATGAPPEPPCPSTGASSSPLCSAASGNPPPSPSDLSATPLTSAFLADARLRHSAASGPRTRPGKQASSRPASLASRRALAASGNESLKAPRQVHAAGGPRPCGAVGYYTGSPQSSSKFLNSVIQQGWLQKWTNLVSSWRPRYFYVMPGLFKYSVQKGAPPKEVFMLNQCVIRLCPYDPVRFEVEVVDQQTLYLRTETLEEKQLWYAAFKQAQRALLNCARHPALPLASLSSFSEKSGPRPPREAAGAQSGSQGSADRAPPGSGDRHRGDAGQSGSSESPARQGASPSSSHSSSSLSSRSSLSSLASSRPPGAQLPPRGSSQEFSPTGSFLSSSTGSVAGALAGAVASGMNYAAAYATSKFRGSLLSSASSPSSSAAPSGSGASASEGTATSGSTTAVGAATGTGAPANASGPLSPSLQSLGSTGSASLEWLGKEGSPLVLLLENVIASRQQVQSTSAEIRALQAGALKEVGAIVSSSAGTGAHELKRQLVALLQKIDSLQVTVERHFSTTEALLAEENSQRRQLEKSLRSMAKQNYKLEKTQQRMLALGALPDGAQSSGAGGTTAGASVSALAQGASAPPRGGAGVPLETDHQLSSSSGEEDDDDVEFFECEDQEAYGSPQDLPPPPAVPESPEDLGSGSTAASAAARATASGAEAMKKGEEPSNTLVPVKSPAYYALSLLFPSDVPPILNFLEASAGRLGGVMPQRRTALSKPRTEFKVGLWSILKDCIGKDLSRISMPVYFNEPTSFLQRLLEDFQYADLVHAASLFPDPVDRLLLVTLFAISPYASATGRTYKPFNPLLGETFEFTHRGYNFIAEQVGHHPPRTAYHVSNDRFLCWGDVVVRNRFTGKSLEVTTPGTVHVVFPSVDDHYTYRRVKLLVHNVIWGKLWAEVDGTTLIQNQKKGDYSIIQFLRKGWLDKSMHMIRAIVFSAAGRPVYRLSGSWSHALYVEEYEQCRAAPNAPQPVPGSSMRDYWRSEGPPPSDSPDNKLQHLVQGMWDTIPVKEGSRRLIWRPAVRPAHSDAYYGFGYLTMELNEITDEYDPEKGAVVAPTDSRFRPDQKLYEEGRVEEAIEEKTRLEEKQRSAARLRPRGEEDYDPLWFAKGEDPITHEPAWIYKGGYWEAKAEAGFSDSPDIF
ncbi:oxysterol-binding family protein, related [Neospora caninum Liverpool]|uniref:Oxysterol-binding family protein, related n=1 Tax=Neospora caninum (strain Liverpool) TaxID=572307 RepID=F0VBI3_NEOCL|nr:oxysterol-binding family protein, related [Neospora caninum Liverpool]CBZ50967.1 oxysterol-binding family protein, related [Neospora caninum Liverpool]|eukprot:XP_003881000.1 oxysterol-binding family protein, related [Neospora caninum Liverpool]